jgi:hypothetical protein
MENLKGRNPISRPRCNVRIILKWVLKECGFRMWTGFSYYQRRPILYGVV